MNLIYQRDGTRGCFYCGNTDDGFLEFMYIDTSKRRYSVSYYLRQHKWKEAKIEAQKCRIRCVACHRRREGSRCHSIYQTRTMLDILISRPDNTSKWIPRTLQRGMRRYLVAKLQARQCKLCGLECTLNNALLFEFDHIDTVTKKYNMSQLHSKSDAEFDMEITKCRLLCHKCHLEHTRHQHQVGDIVRARVNKKRARDSLNDTNPAPNKYPRLVDIPPPHPIPNSMPPPVIVPGIITQPIFITFV